MEFSLDSILFDHTYQTGEGFYMKTENQMLTAGKRARLFSPIYKKHDSGVCLNFWYRMSTKDGADSGIFNIYIRENSVLKEDPIWSMTRSEVNLWRTTSVTIKSITDFQVKIENFLIFLKSL